MRQQQEDAVNILNALALSAASIRRDRYQCPRFAMPARIFRSAWRSQHSQAQVPALIPVWAVIVDTMLSVRSTSRAPTPLRLHLEF